MAALAKGGSSAGGDKPALVPCLMISKGRIMLPAEGGPIAAVPKNGGTFDLFEIADRLIADYERLYVVDLDGVDRDQPQLDYLQEIARGGEIWVDAGVRTADQAIDVLVAGAQRAVLSTAFLRSDRELRKAWRLSSDLVFEIEVRDGAVAGRAPEWTGRGAFDVATAARAEAPTDLVLSYREAPVDWTVARALARDGPLWVDGSFELSDAPKLREYDCRGAIFHVHEFLSQYESPLPGA
ncbi:MAG TPA: HisA/HisF-related TIM barrel protein [Thermoplasmata archaeon]|nr:HisA/HisF-related TIM barrel protein [Thermoplasmata archaeon]